MNSPRGSLSSISKTLKRFARYGDAASMRAYVRGASFLHAFNGLDPERRHSAMMAYVEALAECEAKARLPLAAPVPLNARTSARLANWRNPAMLAKLAAAYARAHDDEGAARLLGVTVGAARLAKRRYLDRAATGARSKSPYGAADGRLVRGVSP
jgi:hypothetical protein